MVFVELNYRRIVGLPANRCKRLRGANEQDLQPIQIELNGYALRWEALDEDLTLSVVVAGHFQKPLSAESA